MPYWNRFKDDIVKEFRKYITSHEFENGLAMMEGLLSFFLYLAGKMEERFLLLHRHDAYELARNNPVCREHLETIYYCLVGMFEHAIVEGHKGRFHRPCRSQTNGHDHLYHGGWVGAIQHL